MCNFINKEGVPHFTWDKEKENDNVVKHGISFAYAARVFQDPHRKIVVDEKHSEKENRFFCIGRVEQQIITVRFMFRENYIRIFGAGNWRKGRKFYEKDER